MSKRQSIRDDVDRAYKLAESVGILVANLAGDAVATRARLTALEMECKRARAVQSVPAAGGFVGYSAGDTISSPVCKPVPVEHLDATAFGRRVRVRAGDGSFVVTGHLVGYRFDTEVTESPLIGHGPVDGLVTITLTIDDHAIDAHPGDGTTVTYLDNPKEQA